MKALFALIGFCALPSLAMAACPQVPDHGEALDALISAAQTAPDEYSAQLLSNDMWALWADAPDDTAQRMLDDGMARRASYDLEGAIGHFEQLIDYCPDYAEGYNQRAFALFLKGSFDAALADLDMAIQLSPKHIGALSGKAMTLIGLGRTDEGQKVLREALALNPWLKERHFLQGEAPKPQTDL